MESKKCVLKKVFGPPKTFRAERFYNQKNLHHKSFGPEKKRIWIIEISGPKKFVMQKKWGSPNILAPKMFLRQQIYSRPKFVLDPKIMAPRNIF